MQLVAFKSDYQEQRAENGQEYIHKLVLRERAHHAFEGNTVPWWGQSVNVKT